MSTVLIDTDDLGEAQTILNETYDSRIGTLPDCDAATHTRLIRSTVGPLNVDELEFSYDLEYDMDPPEAILLVRVRSGSVSRAHGTEVFGAGTVGALGADAAVPITGQVRQARYDVVNIDRSLLSRVAAGPRGAGEPSVVLTGEAAVSDAASMHMARAVDYVARDVAARGEVSQTPLIVSTVQQYLAATMLATFPNSALLDPTAEDRNDSTPVLLRRAIAFIDDNAHRDITLGDIADSIYVTPRSVQYMFRKHRDCTPMEYVRRVRLHYAHLDLVAGSLPTASVGRIAAKWGFSHTGRFATYYRQAYGESPHQTLRR